MDGQDWFIAGTIPLIAAGGAHALGALFDTVHPTFFTPVDDAVRPVADGTGIRLRARFGGDGAQPSMWRVWLGVHVTHGLGIACFALLCLLIAVDDFTVVERIGAIEPLAIAFSAALAAICARYFFYGPLLITSLSTACFVLAAVAR